MKEKKLLNLTPHQLKVIDEEGNELIVLPSHGSVRVSEEVKQIDTFNSLPIYEKKLKNELEFIGITKEEIEKADGVVVSLLAGKLMKQHYPHIRVFTPGNIKRVNNPDGSTTIAGCIGLIEERMHPVVELFYALKNFFTSLINKNE